MPTFSEPITNIEWVFNLTQISRKDTEVYLSPQASDNEGDQIFMQFEQKREMPCGCLVMEQVGDRFRFTLLAYRLTEKDEGTTVVDVMLADRFTTV